MEIGFPSQRTTGVCQYKLFRVKPCTDGLLVIVHQLIKTRYSKAYLFSVNIYKVIKYLLNYYYEKYLISSINYIHKQPKNRFSKWVLIENDDLK